MDAARTDQALTLTVRLTGSAIDARRGIVRLHPQVLAALGLSAWDPVLLTARRSTGALAAVAPGGTPRGTLLCDDLVLANLGVADGADVAVAPAPLREARRVEVAGSPQARALVSPGMLRLGLLGKLVCPGDTVSMLPQDATAAATPDRAAEFAGAGRSLSASLGVAWTTTLLTVVDADPGDPAVVTTATAVGWHAGGPAARDAARTPDTPVAPGTDRATAGAGTGGGTGRGRGTGAGEPAAAPPLEDLAGLEPQVRALREWFDLGFHNPDVLRRLGSEPHLGVLVTGPAGSGRTTLVRAVAADVGATVVRLWAPGLAATEAGAATDDLRRAVQDVRRATPAVLLVEDVESLAPREGAPPVATVLADLLRQAVATPGVAVVCTATHAEDVAPALRAPELLDREIALPLPDRARRARMLEVMLRSSPLAADVRLEEVAARTPGFVAVDLLALRREAALRAALRQRGSATPTIAMADLLGALDVVRPTTLGESAIDVPDLSLDDVGDMVGTKRALTEAVLWPLRYPDTFSRLGVSPPRGLLLYGPPGCGKTYLVRALAGSGQANVLSVKGAELLSKWVGESERGVRELFRRAREAAPALVFLDEVDALAPVRGQSTDGGVTDRVVASLLTELDGVEALRDVVVIGATNRPDLVDPALLRPGRLERLVYVPPPDAAARAAILRAAARNTPLAPDVDLDGLAGELDGHSAADCAALVREAALAAMRRSLDAGQVTAGDVASARRAVRPSLRAEQVAALAAYARVHSPE